MHSGQRQRSEAGLCHAKGLPDSVGCEGVEAPAGEVFGEVTKDEGGSVGVLCGLAGRLVQGFAQDAAADVLGVVAVEIPEVRPEGDAGGVG